MSSNESSPHNIGFEGLMKNLLTVYIILHIKTKTLVQFQSSYICQQSVNFNVTLFHSN